MALYPKFHGNCFSIRLFRSPSVRRQVWIWTHLSHSPYFHIWPTKITKASNHQFITHTLIADSQFAGQEISTVDHVNTHSLCGIIFWRRCRSRLPLPIRRSHHIMDKVPLYLNTLPITLLLGSIVFNSLTGRGRW